MSTLERLRIGFIPLADAASLLIAKDKGFAVEQGLDIELTREVSWANVREKLNAGIFDAAHMLAPMPIASTLGMGHANEPLVAPFILAVNGNAITVSPTLYQALRAEIGEEPATPLLTSKALAEVVRRRRCEGHPPLTFGMTFPFSTHNYQLRFWMAAGGVDPDEDVRLMVLPPPYMVESLTSGQVDGFCVGAPWNSVAVRLGVGHILHLGSEIVQRLAEKVLAVRANWAAANEDVLLRLMKALMQGAKYLNNPENHVECAALLSQKDRIGADVSIIGNLLAGRIKLEPDGETRKSSEYLILGKGLEARPNPVHAAWLYAQMVWWRQTELSANASANACGALSPDYFDKAFSGITSAEQRNVPQDSLGAFTGPLFNMHEIDAYLTACR